MQSLMALNKKINFCQCKFYTIILILISFWKNHFDLVLNIIKKKELRIFIFQFTDFDNRSKKKSKDNLKIHKIKY